MKILYFVLGIIILITGCKEEFTRIQLSDNDHGIAFVSIETLSAKKIKFDQAMELPIFFIDNPNMPLISQPLYDQSVLSGFLVKTDSLKEVTVEVILKSHYPEMEPLTNIRFAEKPDLNETDSLGRFPTMSSKFSNAALQMEGPGWENERVAFRNYFDQRNGMDIYGKRIQTMVLDEVGVPGAPSYHDLQDWGQDILVVGNSLGAGALALQIGDSLHRIAPGADGSAKVLYEGPLQSAIRLQFDNWKVGDRVYQVIHDIIIKSGTRYYGSRVTINGLIGDESLVTGIVNIASDSLYSYSGQNEVAFGTFDNQAFSGEKLGMAIALNKADLVQAFPTPDTGPGITQTYAIALRIRNATPVSFRFYVCWEYESEDFSTYEGFSNFIQSDLN
ncbi:MAG: DUF4861 family protein [Bacteroidota bacterium]